MHGDIKYLKLKDVKRGDRFVEEDGGCAVLCEATEDAHEVHEEGRAGWLCRVKPITGDTPMTDENGLVTLFECFNPGGYGLHLYQEVGPDTEPAPSAATCPDCGRPWSEHEMGVPTPYCPVPVKSAPSAATETPSPDIDHGLNPRSLHPKSERRKFFEAENERLKRDLDLKTKELFVVRELVKEEMESLRADLAAKTAELERERMRLAACGVVAMANTKESAAEARKMHPDYMSASCSDVMKAVDREMQHREDLAATRQRCERLEALLKVAKCPDDHCNNEGTTWIAMLNGGGEAEQLPQQCQWCDERKQALNKQEPR